YDKGTINWILGQKKYWSSKFDQYLITGQGEDFIYPAGQHSVNILSDGKLSIFNNGYNSNHEKAVSCKSLQNNESYAMVYNLDLNNKTATVDYKFGGKEYFSYALSSYTYGANNHKLFNSGWHFTDAVNYNSSSCTQFSNDKYETHLIEFDDKNNIVAHLHIKESKFEALKADIYNLAEISVKPSKKEVIANHDPNLGKYTSTMEADKYEELSEADALKYQDSEYRDVPFILYNNRIKYFGGIPDSMQVKITFISPSGRTYRYVLKEANKEVKDFIILDNLPKGRYYIYTEWNGDLYTSGQHIELG
ncbi:MAG: aryl-sulfate sulfotransferase, partial [Bacilli bacterium]|nr:aryl-sulfate sulfotransferase [Bacilli bacterium]